MIQLCDTVSGCNAGFLRRISFHNILYHWLHKSMTTDQNNRKHKCHQEIKHRSGRNYTDTGQRRFTVKRTLIVTLSILALHHAGTAKRQQFYRIFCFSSGKSYNRRSQSKTKFIYPNTVLFCQQKMSPFMEQYDHTEKNDRNNKFQSTTCLLYIHTLPVLYPGSLLLPDVQYKYNVPYTLQ